jgi:hypothetical protein
VGHGERLRAAVLGGWHASGCGCLAHRHATSCAAPHSLSPPAFRSCLPAQPQDDVAGCFDYYAGCAEGLDGQQYSAVDVGMDEFKVAVRREPLGVVALITPWN